MNYTKILKEAYDSHNKIFYYWLAFILTGELLAIGLTTWYLVQEWNTVVSVPLLGLLLLVILGGALILKIKKEEFSRSRIVMTCSITKILEEIRDLIKDQYMIYGLEKADLTDLRDEDNVNFINSLSALVSDEDMKKITRYMLRKGGYVKYDKQ